VLVRFGRWQQILAEKPPRKGSIFMNGVWHYARGLAYLHTGNEAAAADELVRLTGLREHIANDAEYLIANSAAGTLLQVAEELLRGDILARQGDFHNAVAHIANAVRLEDTLLYNEPPDWYFPVRHVLGAILLDAGLAAQAESVYWEDLKRYPNNGFSLFGLIQALNEQDKADIAAEIKVRFDQAWSAADVQLTNSRF
jgi:tetratricopeptide (TPR) repeat protein